MRKNGTCPWLRPDGKTQVTVEYKKDGGAVVPVRVHTILISTQHNPGERCVPTVGHKPVNVRLPATPRPPYLHGVTMGSSS